jgi:hypothetical protein
MLNSFFTGFTRVTGTEINGNDRVEVYKVSATLADPTSELVVGPGDAHCRGCGGEYIG